MAYHTFLIDPKPVLIETISIHGVRPDRASLEWYSLLKPNLKDKLEDRLDKETLDEMVDASLMHWINPLTQPYVWSVELHPHVKREDFLPVFGTRIKLMHMAKLSSKYLTRGISDHFSKNMHLLFGEPPMFSVKAFDHWWTLRPVESSYTFDIQFLQTNLEALEGIVPSNDETDRQLEILLSYRKAFELSEWENNEELKESIRFHLSSIK